MPYDPPDVRPSPRGEPWIRITLSDTRNCLRQVGAPPHQRRLLRRPGGQVVHRHHLHDLETALARRQGQGHDLAFLAAAERLPERGGYRHRDLVPVVFAPFDELAEG